MASTRPNLKRPRLTLDEQSFQSLLSAAFTIQEHNDQLSKDQAPRAPAEALREPTANSVCPHCGGVKPATETRCPNCSVDQFRPGERLQRNWASMWLMSQEQGLWPERSGEIDQVLQKARESARKAVPPLAGERRPLAPSTRDSGRNGVIAWPLAKEMEASVRDQSALLNREAESEWAAGPSADRSREDLAPRVAEATVEPLELSEGEDASPIEAGNDASSHPRLADWQVTLRFHRADVYLGAAILLALLALLWPAASAPRRAALRPWQRALVTLGIAEAPAPVVHLQGDPGIQVWVDPHTALYYCPGEEQYGTTVGGHFSGQRDAQMDRFEPAGRSVCQ